MKKDTLNWNWKRRATLHFQQIPCFYICSLQPLQLKKYWLALPISCPCRRPEWLTWFSSCCCCCTRHFIASLAVCDPLRSVAVDGLVVFILISANNSFYSSRLWGDVVSTLISVCWKWRLYVVCAGAASIRDSITDVQILVFSAVRF